MESLGAVLTRFAALTARSSLRVRFAGPLQVAIPALPLASAAVYAPFAAWMLCFGFKGRSLLLAWQPTIAAAAVVGDLATSCSRRNTAAPVRSGSRQ